VSQSSKNSSCRCVCRCVKTVEEFQQLEKDWIRLTTEPLRSFEWHFAWWSNFQHLGELSIFVYEDDGSIVGIAPFFLDRWNGQKRLRFIGSGKTCTDYAGLIVTEKWRTAFSNAVAVCVTESVAMLELEGVDGAALPDVLNEPLSSQFWRYETEMDSTWQLDLPSDWAGFLSKSKKSLKRKIKKAEKRLASDEFEIRSSLKDLPLAEAWDHLIRLHQSRFKNKGEAGAFKDEHFESFLQQSVEALAKEGRAEIIVAYHQDEPFGAHLLLHDQQRTLLYLAGILCEKSKLEPGHLLITFAVRQAIENGQVLFDFLRGNQPYKSYWGAVPNRLQTIRFVSRSKIPTILNQGFLVIRRFKHQMDSVLNMRFWAST